MPWCGPRFEGDYPTLGWKLLEWLSEVLPSPRDHDRPLVFTDEQARIIARWYALHPVTGKRLYRRGVSRRAKGWGKSPVEAAKAIAELCGEVVPAGWDARGEPVGRPWGTEGLPQAWVQIAAVSEDQTENTHSVVYDLLTANDGRAADRLSIDVGLTRSYLRDGARRGKLEPVTAAAGSREGQPVTYGVLDETHLYRQRNGGVKLARTIRRNAAKMNGSTYETTNAFEPGEGSVAQMSHQAWERGTEGVFYDGVEAPKVDIDNASDAELRSALSVAYGDSWWVDLDRLVREVRDPDTPREDAERFYFNWNTSAHGRAVEPGRWDELADGLREVEAGSYIGVGFDGSISDDATVLRGCTRDGYSFLIGKWVRPSGPAGNGWRVPRSEVHDAVALTFARFQVGRFLADPPKWYSEIDEWQRLYGDDVVLAFDTNSDLRMGRAVDRWLTDIRTGAHTHDGDAVTSEHVKNAHRRKARAKDPDDDTRTLYTLVKGEDGGKIDAAVADVLAVEAAQTMPEEPLRAEPMVMFG